MKWGVWGSTEILGLEVANLFSYVECFVGDSDAGADAGGSGVEGRRHGDDMYPQHISGLKY